MASLPKPRNGQYYTYEEFEAIKNSGDPQMRAELIASMNNRQAQTIWEDAQRKQEMAEGPSMTESLMGAALPAAATGLGLWVGDKFFGTGADAANRVKETLQTATQVGKPAVQVASNLPSAAPSAPGILGATRVPVGGAPAVPTILSATRVPVGVGQYMPDWMAGTQAGQAGQYLSSGLQSLGMGGQYADMIGAGTSYLGPALGAYSMYNLLGSDQKPGRSIGEAGSNALSGAAAGAAMGSIIPGPGTAIGAIIGGLSGAVHGLTGSGKLQPQLNRDEARKALQQSGVVDKNFRVLGYDIGKEDPTKSMGGEYGTSPIAGEHRYDIDINSLSEGGHRVLGMADALAKAITPVDKSTAGYMAGYFANAAAAAGGDARQNLLKIAGTAGADYNVLRNNIASRADLSETEKANYFNALDEMYQAGAYAKDPSLSRDYTSLTVGQTGKPQASTQTAPQTGKQTGKILWNTTYPGVEVGPTKTPFGEVPAGMRIIDLSKPPGGIAQGAQPTVSVAPSAGMNRLLTNVPAPQGAPGRQQSTVRPGTWSGGAPSVSAAPSAGAGLVGPAPAAKPKANYTRWTKNDPRNKKRSLAEALAGR